MGTNDAWLALGAEEALEPELPICDPHHHLWDHRQGSGVVSPRYLLDEFLADLDCGHNVVSTVFIECGTMFDASAEPAFAPVGETEFANGIAAMSASGRYGPTRIGAGLVGTAYLTDGDAVAAVLDRHLEVAGRRLRGIRQAAAWHESAAIPNHRTEPAPGLYLDPMFRAGFAHLAPRGLSYEGWCYHTQLPELVDLARAFPATIIILDHFGGPLGIGPYAGRGDEVFAEWRTAVEPLAGCPNVHAKLGGLGMEVNGYGWHERDRPPSSAELAEANRRYHEQAIELFGAERCMFESNFPVDRLSSGYGAAWNAFKRISAGCSADERAALFHDTAARVYRL